MKYTEKDNGRECPHCKRGKIEPHSVGNGVMLWCSDCGGNSPESPPSVRIAFTK